ncbi:non-ribosomal peptide synthetase [Eggerthella sp. YY7918]|uniref:non-ribosomal peptide synthetase n=1 Tax=Eggerthella sp. (strain YY7918) TaxID=502558 RepID=UPI0002170FAE|nr:non-ribosomal peptide synthetase [Eggerthella sp. YY7918]BAK43323.1 non-ribosomal peptide synthetase module [Eggerthella sp. YY7918]
MSINELVEEFESFGIHLWCEDGELRFRAPQGVLTEERRKVLVSNKEALLAYLDTDNARIVADPERNFNPFPLTQMQSAYQLGRHRAFDYGGIPCTAYMEVSYIGDVALDIERAWNELVLKHGMLRAVISDDGYQRVLENVDYYHIQTFDARNLGSSDAGSLLNSVREQMTSAPRDSSTWPLFDLRTTVLEGKTILHLFIELIVVDAASVQILLKELDAALSGTLEAAPDITFRDYVISERSLRNSPKFYRDKSYWANRLEGLPPAPDLPISDHGSGSCRCEGFYRLSHCLEKEFWQGIKVRSENYGVTVSNVILTAFAEAIGRWSQHRRFTLNIPIFNRLSLHEKIGDVIGDFTSVSLLGIDLDAAGETFAERVNAIGRQLYDDLDHRLYTGLDVMAELGRRQGKTPLFPIVFTSTIGSAPGSGNSKGSFVLGLTQTPQVWIDCQVMASGEEGLLTWDIRRGLFPDGMVEAAFESFKDVVERLSCEDEVWEEASPLRLPASQRLQRNLVNDTSLPLPERLLHEPILEWAEHHPDSPAIADREGVLTYREISLRAKAIACALQDAGCCLGDRVAVCMEKGSDQLVSVLGTGIVGAAYVPVDPSQPTARRNRIFSDAKVSCILSQSWIGRKLDVPIGVRVLNVDELSEEFDAAPFPRLSPDCPAYVIYTSGSTGIPKGVEVSHRAASNTVQDMNMRFRVGPNDRVLGVANLSFDLSVYDFYGILSVGGMVVLPDADRGNDPSHWGDLIEEYGITVWNSVPSQMQMLQDYEDSRGDASGEGSLRLVLLSGDWIPTELPSRIRRNHPHAEVVGLGGATEASIWSIFYPIGDVDPEWKSIPYGKPLSNQYFRILNESLQDCPDFVPGELYIGGSGLATGYFGDSQKTEESFIVHPESGHRLYKTGDFGKYLPDGTIEFLGRRDSQVKIRGHRIELGEIEAILRSHQTISDAAVFDFGDRGSDFLVGFAQLAHTSEDSSCQEKVKAAAIRACERIESQIDRDKFRELMFLMDEVAIQAMLSQIRNAGLLLDVGSCASKRQILDAVNPSPERERLFRRWLDALEAAGALAYDAESGLYHCRVGQTDIAESWKRIEFLGGNQSYGPALLDFIRICLSRLGDLIKGRFDVRGVMFPEGEFGAARAVYSDNIVANAANSIASAAIASIVEKFEKEHPGIPCRIVEVGAGIAGTTPSVIETVRGACLKYLFTDVSDFFLSKARETFKEYPWMSYGIFDINEDVVEQGYLPSSVDIILCANVLHNARNISSVLSNLRKMLAPGGWLVFLEPIRRHNYSQLVSVEFVFAEEDFSDERESTGQLFFTKDQWMSVLSEAGADAICCVPEEASVLSTAGQGVFLAHFKGDVAFATNEEIESYMANHLPGYMVPKEVQLVDALPRTDNGKLDRSALRSSYSCRKTCESIDALSAIPSLADDLEFRIASIWSDLLGVDGVSREQDFYSLGGDSLLLSRVVGKIKEGISEASGFEWAVLLRQLLRDPTVKGLADFLRKSEREVPSIPNAPKKPSSAFLLESKASNSACVFVHAGTGTLQPYQALISHSGDYGERDLVGIELDDLDGYLSIPSDVAISALASRYSHDLMRLGQYDSFVIVGYCLGGFLAAEISRALLEAGVSVERLVVISSSQPPVVEDELMIEYLFARSMGADLNSLGLPPDSDDFAQAVRCALEKTPGILPEGCLVGMADEYESYGRAFCRFSELSQNERLAAVHRASSASGAYNTGGYSLSEFSRLFRVFRQSLLSVARHSPEPYAGPMILLRNTGSSSLMPGELAGSAGCWEQLCAGRFESHDIPGDHFCCMGNSNVSLIYGLIEGASK